MTANHVFLIALGVVALISFALPIVSLKFGLKWAKVADISLLKAFGIYLLTVLVAVVFGAMVGVACMLLPVKQSELVMNLVGNIAYLLAACVTIAYVFKVRYRQAALSLVPLVVASGAFLGLMFVERAFVYEAFIIPTNSMAPTLLGEHLEATCPRCGEPAYGPTYEAPRQVPPEGWQMICSKEMRSVFVGTPPKIRGPGDRMLICKLIKPKRWDVIVFRFPQDPSVNYVKRLVGLPGERLEIREGAIWINGEKQVPPEAIRGIHFSPTIEEHGREVSGPGSVPVTLGADECFVLGDFANLAADSRMWEQGAPGHPPYAVPESNIIGVVINTYWPISRWKSFR